MSEMVERVTEAIVGAVIDAGGTIDYRVQDVARAAIAAMREPTEAMLTASKKATWIGPGYSEAAWRAMVDGALSPSPERSETR